LMGVMNPGVSEGVFVHKAKAVCGPVETAAVLVTPSRLSSWH
jgi:hypothetical protein